MEPELTSPSASKQTQAGESSFQQQRPAGNVHTHSRQQQQQQHAMGEFASTGGGKRQKGVAVAHQNVFLGETCMIIIVYYNIIVNIIVVLFNFVMFTHKLYLFSLPR